MVFCEVCVMVYVGVWCVVMFFLGILGVGVVVCNDCM